MHRPRQYRGITRLRSPSNLPPLAGRTDVSTRRTARPGNPLFRIQQPQSSAMHCIAAMLNPPPTTTRALSSPIAAPEAEGPGRTLRGRGPRIHRAARPCPDGLPPVRKAVQAPPQARCKSPSVVLYAFIAVVILLFVDHCNSDAHRPHANSYYRFAFRLRLVLYRVFDAAGQRACPRPQH